MADSDDDTTRNMLQYLIFVLLLVIGLSPFLLMLWKNSAYRERLRDTFCCKDCSDICTQRVHYDEADLRTLRELDQPPQRESVGINGAYRMYQARRSRLSLRLASWREDVKRGGDNDDRLHHKLAQIQTAQYRRQQTQPAASATTTSTTTSAPANRANSTPNIPFDIRVVEINDRVNESNSSSAAASSNVSVLSNDSEEESVYELVPPTPTNEQRDTVRTGRRSVVTAEEEEEEKEDVAPRDHEIV